MAITTTYLSYAIPSTTVLSNRPPNAYVRFVCDTEGDLPTVNVVDGDRVYTADSGKRWDRVSGSWVTGSTGGGGAHNNLQPYIVVYMHKRTA